MSDPPRKIPWVDERLRAWGRAKYAIMFCPAAGPRSIMGRIVAEGAIGAAIRSTVNTDPEVMVGHALEVSRAIVLCMSPLLPPQRRLTAEQYEAIFVYYAVLGMTLKDKARRLGCDPASIIHRRNRAQAKLSGFLGRGEPVYAIKNALGGQLLTPECVTIGVE